MFKSIISLTLIFWVFCDAATYSPNATTTKVSANVSETSLNNLLNVVMNAGLFDIGMNDALLNDTADVDWLINSYFYSAPHYIESGCQIKLSFRRLKS